MAETLGSLVGMATDQNPYQGISQGVSQGISHGMELAKTQQAVEESKQKVETMKDTLDTAKFNKLNGYMQTLAKSQPDIAKRLVPTMQKSLQQSGLGVDPSILELVASSDDYKRRILALSATSDELAKDPEKRKAYVQAHAEIGDFDKGLQSLEHYSKQDMSLQISEAKNKSLVEAAGVRAKGTVDAAQARIGPNSPQAARVQNQVNSQYQSTMKGWEGALQASDMLQKTIDDVDLGKLNASKNVRGELNAKIASLIGGGKPSTVFGTKSVEQDSLYQDFMDKVNKITGEAGNTLTDGQWNQIKKEVHSFRDSNAKMHEDAYMSMREAIHENYRSGIDNRFSKFRQSKGLASQIPYQDNGQAPAAPAAQAPAASQTPAPRGTPPPQDVIDAKIQAAKAAGYSEAEIADYVKKLKGQ